MSKARDYIPGLGSDFKIGADDVNKDELKAALVGDLGSGGVEKSYVDTELAKKANTSHTHTIANVTNLQTTLDGKAATSHTHTIANITSLQTSLDAKLTASKAATQAASTATDVAGLVTDLNALVAKLKAAGIMS